ncbi:hypothetical protein PRZ48_012350 [Zasmidium cellare]|uniref:Uncharacterized protein n=1 Tax=Zasmidium cellare TaxID=395010 RepID=A0ABR0E4K0_ZASCE|nr:hypothetical protein PRZ48_012350 [Zasmidium cellare]
MATGILHSQSPALLKTASVLSLAPLLMGLTGTLSPTTGFKFFSIPTPTTPEARKLGTNLMLFWASRDLFMAAVINIAAWNGDRRTLGMVYVAMVGVGLFDAVIAERQTGGGKWAHLGFVPVLLGVDRNGTMYSVKISSLFWSMAYRFSIVDRS